MATLFENTIHSSLTYPGTFVETDPKCNSLFLDSKFCSTDLYLYNYASAMWS